MKAYTKAPLLIAVLVLAVPALALATSGKEHAEGHGQEHSQGSGQPSGAGPEYTPSPPPQAKAYGKYCQGESKKHVKGEKGTAFSRCVKAAAKLRHDEHQAAE
jgi:hypothetical protein